MTRIEDLIEFKKHLAHDWLRCYYNFKGSNSSCGGKLIGIRILSSFIVCENCLTIEDKKDIIIEELTTQDLFTLQIL